MTFISERCDCVRTGCIGVHSPGACPSPPAYENYASGRSLCEYCYGREQAEVAAKRFNKLVMSVVAFLAFIGLGTVLYACNHVLEALQEHLAK
jgi:hypothetical protein